MATNRNDKTGSICAALNGQSIVIRMPLYDMRDDRIFTSEKVTDTSGFDSTLMEQGFAQSKCTSAIIMDTNGKQHDVADLGPCSAHALLERIADKLY